MQNPGCTAEGHTVPPNTNSSVMNYLVFLSSIKKKKNQFSQLPHLNSQYKKSNYRLSLLVRDLWTVFQNGRNLSFRKSSTPCLINMQGMKTYLYKNITRVTCFFGFRDKEPKKKV